MNFHFILQLLLHLVERQNLDNSNNFSKRNCYGYDENRERPSSTSAIPSTLSNNFMILLITNSLFGWFLGFHIALHWCSWQMCVQSTMRNETELPCCCLPLFSALQWTVLTGWMYVSPAQSINGLICKNNDRIAMLLKGGGVLGQTFLSACAKKRQFPFLSLLFPPSYLAFRLLRLSRNVNNIKPFLNSFPRQKEESENWKIRLFQILQQFIVSFVNENI